MEIDFAEYRLSCELLGHEDDVRGICVCGDSGIATASRDRTIRFWAKDHHDGDADKLSAGKYVSSKILLGHTSFVAPLVWISPNDEFKEGGLVSGGMDTLVMVWDLRSCENVQTLKGHQTQVTGVAVVGDGHGSEIVSSSEDCTLKWWTNGKYVESWDAHKAPIRAVIKLPSGEIVSGSSDTTLKLWNGKTCVRTFVGHTGTVRGLALMPDSGILSASHDGSVRLWAVSGELLMEMVGHTSIVYSVDSHASGLVVSGSEDCSAMIWKDGVCVQSLAHPGCVRDVKFLQNGDIVTACSDGAVRVWTTHQDNLADSQDLEAFISKLSAFKCSRKKIGGVKLDELPGLEALQVPGTSDGQTKIVKEGDNGVPYACNPIENKWDKIGDGPDDNPKRPVHEGTEYDFVFTVNIGDGLPLRKFPYNRSDNPYSAADKWLLKEDLPLECRQQIVYFILRDTGQKDIPESSNHAAAANCEPTYKHIPEETSQPFPPELVLFLFGTVFAILLLGVCSLLKYLTEYPPPEYVLSQMDVYTYELSTQNGAKFYVNSTFWFNSIYPPKSDRRSYIEKKIDTEYKLILMRMCSYETQRDQGENAHCEKMRHFGLIHQGDVGLIVTRDDFKEVSEEVAKDKDTCDA